MSGSNQITYTYDNAGELKVVQDANSLISFTYDSDGRLQTSTETGSSLPQVTLTYGYDYASNLTSVSDSLSGSGGAGQGLTTYIYDNAFRLTTITQTVGGLNLAEVLYTYDSGGRQTEKEWYVNSTQFAYSTFTYDQANRVTGITDRAAASRGSTLVDNEAYTYDSGGRVLTYTYGATSHTVTYSYDNSDQVTGAAGAISETFGYDSGGNRNTTGYTTGAGNEMTSGGGYTYTYDNAGDMTSRTQLSTGFVWNYSYDYHNRMTVATEKNSGGTTLNQVTYTYDALDRRIVVNSNGTITRTAYEGSGADANPYADFNGTTLHYRYLYGPAVDELLARVDASANMTWYMTDKLGSVTDVVNGSASFPTAVDSVTYKTFGSPTDSAATSGDRFKFTGREYDSVTGLYYYRARYYDPNTGRFVSQDSKGFAAGDANFIVM